MAHGIKGGFFSVGVLLSGGGEEPLWAGRELVLCEPGSLG